MEETARGLIVETARRHAPDYYLSALLAPRALRDDLVVLAAFEGELDRIPHQVSEPMLSDIRLQWWRDVIDAIEPTGRGGTRARTGNPLADALAEVVGRHHLDRGALIASIDARWSGPEGGGEIPVFGERARMKARDGAAMRRAARVLGADAEREHYDGLDEAGLALSFARQALVTRANLAETNFSGGGLLLGIKGQLQQARHNLLAARAAARSWPRRLRLAALPVALVEPYLRACERPRSAGRIGSDAILPLTRAWRLWWCARTGRL